MKVTAVIPAAGVGKRFSSGGKKQFFEIEGKPLFFYTLTAVANSYDFHEIIIGASLDDFDFVNELCSIAGIKNFRILQGGSERCETVNNCIMAAETEYVLIHDAVRPFITKDIVKETIKASKITGAAICAVPVRETLKKVDGGTVKKTVDRNNFVLSHTPQVFELKKLKVALRSSSENKIAVTDEAQAMELAGYSVKIVDSSPDNIKVTYIEDIAVVKSLVNKYFKDI